MKEFFRDVRELVGCEMSNGRKRSKLWLIWEWPTCFVSHVWRLIMREYCELFGHKLYDNAIAGPDHGNMDHGCSRCGAYWHVPLY